MFRTTFDATADNFQPQQGSVSGFNLLGLQNMYYDSNSLGMSNMSGGPPSSISSSTLSPPTTPLTPEPTTFGSTTQFPLLTDNSNMNMNAVSMLGSAFGNGFHGADSTLQSTLLLQRQYQYHLLLQQRQQQIALAQQQLALAASAAAANHQGKDDISHSLKMFALLTACNADKNNGSQQDVMQEFASNGHISDDLLQYSNPNASLIEPTAGQTTSTSIPSQPPPGHSTGGHLYSPNPYLEHLNKVWRSLNYVLTPSMAAHAGVPVALSSNVGNASHSNNMSLGLGFNVPVEHMRNNGNNNNNKNNKRQNNNKPKDLNTTNRRCVFCENNNEPEAVICSHSVRDSLGRVLCPKLRTYVCPICKASGDSAHTIKYCPKKPVITMEDAIRAESFRLAKSGYYKPQMKV